MADIEKGELFSPELQKEIKSRFAHIDTDPEKGKRLFFENSGGSLRLKAAANIRAQIDEFPDCPERGHERAKYLKKFQLQGISDIMDVVFDAKDGALITELTASQTMFQMVGAILENVEGGNAVTSELDHPSAYDAVKYYCKKTGKEFRSVPASKVTGGIEVEEILKYVDKDTCLLNIIFASNITGRINDMEAIIKAVREVNPEIYVVTDAVQHTPHNVYSVSELGLDGVNFAPYKFFGTRGSGFAYVSDRVAKLPHRKVLARPDDIWELGTPCPSNFAAFTEVVNYVCWLGEHFTDSDNRREKYVAGMQHIHLQERALLDRLLNGTESVPGLRHINGVHVYCDVPSLKNRDLIIAMGINGLHWTDAVAEYQKRNVTVFDRVAPSPFSTRIVNAIGYDGAIRVSPLHCHDTNDIDLFLQITAEIAKEFSK